MMDFTSLDLPRAPLTEGETWIYYDGPKLFTLKTADEELTYIVNAVDEDDTGDTMIFLAAAQHSARLRVIESGDVEFRDAFVHTADSLLHVITWRWQQETEDWAATVESVNPDQVEQWWLPLPEARLKHNA
jgi:hypothetical protein